MEALAIAALAHAGSAIFRAVVHIAGHESYDSLKLRLNKRLLHNHDLERALHESLVAALKLVEGDAIATSGLHKKEIKLAFNALRAQSLQQLALTIADAQMSGEGSVDLATDKRQQTEFTKAVLSLASDAPEPVRAALHEEHFVGPERQPARMRQSRVRTLFERSAHLRPSREIEPFDSVRCRRSKVSSSRRP
jgi:hypothetical protein